MGVADPCLGRRAVMRSDWACVIPGCRHFIGADQAARAVGTPFGGGLRSSQTGLEVAMIAPGGRDDLCTQEAAAEVFTAHGRWPAAWWCRTR